MSHARQVFRSVGSPSSASFLGDSGSSRFSCSYVCSGRNSEWMTNIAVFFAHSIQCLLSAVIVMMLSMNISTDDTVSVMSTARGPLLQGDPLSGINSTPGVGFYVVS